MKMFEILNRVAWIVLVCSFLVDNKPQRQFLQFYTGISLIVSFVLEVMGI